MARAEPRLRFVAPVTTFALLLLGHHLAGAAWSAGPLLGALALFGLAAVAALGTVGPPRPAADPTQTPAAATQPTTRSEHTETELLGHACELVRRATDAQEASLWVVDETTTHVRRLARAGHTQSDTPEADGAERVVLEGHPFSWPLDEGSYVRLERGRRELPLPWAAEMLLLPLAHPRGVLALGYPGIVPPGAEAAAHTASAHLAEFLALREVRSRAERDELRLRSTLDAVGALAGAHEVAPLAARLGDAVLDATGGAGAAVVSWDADQARGSVLALAGTAPGLPGTGEGFAEGESRAALAAKHAVPLLFADLARERERIPLVTRDEQWLQAPRSALLVPLVVAERGVGALVAWHPQPNHFAEQERELLTLLARVASPSMQGAHAYDALNHRASTDALTGLANRRAFEARLSSASSHFDRYGRPFSLLILDVDHFKRFNDTWGHEAGDRVLQHVAQLLRATVREGDLPARLGGEEFVVLLPETPLPEAVEAAERVRRMIETKAVLWNGRPLSVTASFGVGSCPGSGVPPGELLAAADAALYASKQGGRNRVTAADASAAATSAKPGRGK